MYSCQSSQVKLRRKGKIFFFFIFSHHEFDAGSEILQSVAVCVSEVKRQKYSDLRSLLHLRENSAATAAAGVDGDDLFALSSSQRCDVNTTH